jgi:putative hemolysin
MKWYDILYIVILVILVILSALYSACDMAYSSVNKLRLERSAFLGDKKSKAALKYASDYDSSIATILFGNDFVNILASSLAAVVGGDLLDGVMETNLASFVSSLIILLILLVFGEISPKALAQNNSYSLSRNLTGFLHASSFLFYPFVKPANFLAKKLASPLLEKAEVESPLASDDELEAMVDEIKQEGIIDADQSELLHRSISFKETSCYEIMTPRVKIFGYDIEEPFSKFLTQKDIFVHSRIPVYKGSLDHIIGYFQAKTLLRVLVSGGTPSIDDLILPLVSVPRTMEISSAMALMKESHSHIAIVRDEYGGTEGIVTLEDILEELVGEMWDESDSPKEDIIMTKKKNVFLVNGDMNIERFFERFHLDDDCIEDDYSTLSGWLADKQGHFLKEGDKLTYQKVDIKVLSAEPFNVKQCQVSYHPRRKEADDGR